MYAHTEQIRKTGRSRVIGEVTREHPLGKQLYIEDEYVSEKLAVIITENGMMKHEKVVEFFWGRRC